MNDRDVNKLMTEEMMRAIRHPGQINLWKLAALLVVLLWVCSCYAAWL